LALASQDRIGLEAIKSLHRQLDDDANGNVDLSESDEVKKCELISYVCMHLLISITSVSRM
jgi:stromal interaction molecule 1